MYIRNGSFFNRLGIFAIIVLLLALISCQPAISFAQAADPAVPLSSSNTATGADTGQDPFTDPGLNGSSDTAANFLDIDGEEPVADRQEPRLNRLAGDAYKVLDQKAYARPLLFLNMALGLILTLLLLAYAYSRGQRRGIRYISLYRHRSHI